MRTILVVIDPDKLFLPTFGIDVLVFGCGGRGLIDKKMQILLGESKFAINRSNFISEF